MKKKITDFSITFKTKIFFIISGIASTIWFLARVIPKPSRASYPCMQVAVPWASAFILYIIGISASVFSFKKFRAYIKRSKYALATIFLLLSIFAGTVAIFSGSLKSWAIGMVPPKGIVIEPIPNQPFGEAKGMFPGRVVWVHDPDATNANCDPSEFGNTWYYNHNNDQNVIDKMLSDAIQALTETTSDEEAWKNLFKYHNQTRGKGEVNYEAGEIIFIKINATSTWSGNFNTADLSDVDNFFYGISETSPQLALSLLRQLVNNVGVDQTDIYIGDPMKRIYKHHYDLWTNEFPNINYLDNVSSNHGRVLAEHGEAIIDYSDRGSIITEFGGIDFIYKIFEDCDYLINIPTLKGHERSGVTMFGKNHFGSHVRNNAFHLHPGLVDPDGNRNSGDERFGYGLYRIVVDYLGHELFNNKSLFYLMDALWAAGMEVTQPSKWQMKPFNNHWSSSMFISHDPVAIESVGFDFLKAEYTEEHGHEHTHVQMLGTDDYLYQAADKTFWPDGIEYDPENDGIIIGSLGVHEYWNNPVDMQYSRNMGIGEGIELIKIGKEETYTHVSYSSKSDEFSIYPNPTGSYINITLTNDYTGIIKVDIYNIRGQLRHAFHFTKSANTIEETINLSNEIPGQYFVRVAYGKENSVKTFMINR